MSLDHTQEGTQDVASDRLALAASMQAEVVAGPPEIPGYSMKELLGEGTFGKVFKAVQTRTGQSVAIKILTIGGDRGYLEREVARLAQVAEHPYVCHLIDANVGHNPPYLVTPLLDRSLTSFVFRRPGVEQAATWMEQIAEALQYIHLRGLLHFDLKPANVLMDSAGNSRLMDFGQARLAGRETASLGTFWYMPPEQVWLSGRRGHVRPPEPSWDVYALGATIYEILTGVQPRYTDELARTLAAPAELQTKLEAYRQGLATSPLRPIRSLNAQVDAELARIVERCLHLNPQKRYRELGTLINDLRQRKQRGQGGLAPSTMAAGLGMACVVSLIAGVWLGGRSRPAAPTPTPVAVAVAPAPTPAPEVPKPKPRPVKPQPKPTPKPVAATDPGRPVRPRPVTRPPEPRPRPVVQRPSYPAAVPHAPPPRHRPTPPPERVATAPDPEKPAPRPARDDEGPAFSWGAVDLQGHFPGGYVLDPGPYRHEEGGETAAFDESQPSRRVEIKVQALPVKFAGPAWSEMLKQISREGWRVNGNHMELAAARGQQARWFRLQANGREARRLVLLVPNPNGYYGYSFLCEQPAGDATDLTMLTNEVLAGFQVGDAPLPRL